MPSLHCQIKIEFKHCLLNYNANPGLSMTVRLATTSLTTPERLSIKSQGRRYMSTWRHVAWGEPCMVPFRTFEKTTTQPIRHSTTCIASWEPQISRPSRLNLGKVLNCVVFYLFRAEKERSQYFSEVNDLRAGLDHLSNEKVQKNEMWKVLASAVAGRDSIA